MDSYSIIELKGKQYKIWDGVIFVADRISAQETVSSLVKVLLHKDVNGQIFLGKPYLDKFSVDCSVQEDFKDKKVFTTRYKPKKGYRKVKNFRKSLTKILVNRILPG